MLGHRLGALRRANAAAGVALMMLFALLVLSRARSGLQGNLLHRELLQFLGQNQGGWVDWLLLSDNAGHDVDLASLPIASYGQSLQSTLQTADCESIREGRCDVATSLLESLASWQSTRGRQPLAEIFLILEDVNYHADRDAVSRLVSFRAVGYLLGVGGVLNEQNATSRAVLYLEAADKLNPADYPILRQLAMLYLAEEQYCNLVDVSARGVDLYDSSLFYYYLGRGYDGLNEWDEAVKAYEDALERFPGYEPYIGFLHQSRINSVESIDDSISKTCRD